MRSLLDLVDKGLAPCAAAFQFLTRLPVPVRLEYTDTLFRRSVVFYPLVGLVLGLLLGLGGLLLNGSVSLTAALGWDSLGTAVAAALLLVAWAAMTGALHLDGLMDTADGILSHRTRERMLEIMKDSRTGAMGVIACVLLLLCKWTLLEQWLTLPPVLFLYILPLALIWSRWYMVVAIAFWPYARLQRDEEAARGVGSFFRGLDIRHLTLHTLLALLLSIGLVWLSGIALPLSLDGLRIIATAVISTVLAGAAMSMAISRKLGGLTGDTYGAMNEVLETMLLIVLYIAVR